MKSVVYVILCSLMVFSCSNLHVKVQESQSNFDTKIYGYTSNDEKDIKLDIFKMPLIPVKINDYNTWLQLDFGNAGTITLTSNIKNKIKYSVLSEQNSYWSDGRVRGIIQNIRIDNISLFDVNYSDHECVLADWKMYSSFPFNGLVGLQYFSDRRITIDYRNKKLYVSNTGIPNTPEMLSNTVVIPLISPPEYFPTGIFVKGKINENKTIVYIDSGNSKTSINRKYFRTKPKSIDLDLGGQVYRISNFHEEDNIEFQNYRKDIGIVLGSDFLKNCVITIDRAQGNNQMIIIKK